MSTACNQTPFWQRQPLLPKAIQAYLRARLESALANAGNRQVLAWPTVLGAPRLRQAHPDGLPEALLLQAAEPMLRPLGVTDPARAWHEHLEVWLDTAEAGPTGWRPHPAWWGWGPLVSLRSGWQLAALTPLPPGPGYPLSCGVSLFNHGLFHECHDALEPLWDQATGDLKAGLQGLILMAGGYHHLQLANGAGMLALWAEAVQRLGAVGGRLVTPWGVVDCATSLDLTLRRLDHGKNLKAVTDLQPYWALDRPTWELT